MAKTTLQDLCDISVLKSILPKETSVPQAVQPKVNQVEKQNVTVKKKTKKSHKAATPSLDSTRNIIVADVSLKRKWTDFLMAEYLHSKGISAQELALHKASLYKSLGPFRYANILAMLKGKSAPKTIINHKSADTKRADRSAYVQEKDFSFQSFPVESGAVTTSGTVMTIIFNRKPLEIVVPVKLDKVPSVMHCVVLGNDVKIDEFQLYKQHNVFGKSKNYQFRVTACRREASKYLCTVVDRCYNTQEVISPVEFSVGDHIVCRVDGLREQSDHSKALLLSSPRLYKHAAPIVHKPVQSSDDVYYPNNKRPEAWFREVEGLGKHTATGPFRCSCCNRNFSARQGCKIEFRDIYFCKACADQIFKHSNKGYLRIVYTPMGNGR